MDDETIIINNTCEAYPLICKAMKEKGWKPLLCGGVCSPDGVVGIVKHKELKRYYGNYGFDYKYVKKACAILKHELTALGAHTISFYLFGYILLVVRAEYYYNGKREALDAVVAPVIMRG